MDDQIRVTLEKSNENNSGTKIFVFGMWDVCDVGYLGALNVQHVGYLRCVMFGMWDD